MITPTELGGDLYVGGRPPKGRRSLRLKWTTRLCQNGIWGDEPDGENDVAVVRVADFVRVKLRVGNDIPTLRSVLPQQREGRLLRRGDLLIEKSGGGELQPVGTVVLFDSEREAVCSNFIAVMPVPDGYDSRFLCYLHAALYRAKINTRSIKQTTGIQNLDSYSYLSEHVAVPKLEIQQEIADFLDRETGLIDDLRAKQKRLTDRLEEQLQAVIHRLV